LYSRRREDLQASEQRIASYEIQQKLRTYINEGSVDAKPFYMPEAPHQRREQTGSGHNGRMEIRRKPMIPHVVDPRKVLSNVKIAAYVNWVPALRRMGPSRNQIQIVDAKKQESEYKGYQGIHRE
jgi:hypothetical protein